MNRTRIVSFFLATLLLLLPFSACQRSGANTPEPVDAPTIADLTPTDTLVLYIPAIDESRIQRLIAQYKALYDVKVEVVVVEGDDFNAYTERVVGDLAGGGGPDVLFLDDLAMDVTKAALNGNFLDLTELLTEDEEFSEDDYIAGVFDAGRFGGRQYTIPLSFFSPPLLSEQSKLEELGFNWESIEKTSDFLEEIAHLTPYAGQNANFAQMMDTKNYLGYFLKASGIRLLDYESNVVLPDEEALGTFLHAYKAYFPYDYDASGMIYAFNFGADSLRMGEFVFWLASLSIADLLWNIDTLKESPYGYAFHALPSQTGEIVGTVFGQIAISANAKNPLNAYNFIKMMLSEDIQREGRLLSVFVPIHKESIKKAVYATYMWDIEEGLKFAGVESSDPEMDALIETITGVDRFTQSVSSNLRDMLFDSMLPFFKDEKSYDDCLAELRNKLTFYLSE